MTQKFDIAWPRKFFQRRRHEGIWLIDAVLLERKLGVDGKPTMQIVAKLASINEDRTDALDARERFWHDASSRLGRMTRLTDRDLDEIEALIAARIPKPSGPFGPPEKTVRPSAHPIRGPHQPVILRER
jgi:hypothetical protein